MDPLTITLAIVTLATALKDVVELARRIDDSILRVSRNESETIRRLSRQIIKSVLDLQTFCDEEAEALEKSSVLKTAVVDLHSEMQLLDDRTRAMLRHPPKNKFVAWLKRNKVEGELKLILEHVRDCYLRFTAFSVLRIEGRQVLESTTEKRRTKKPSILLLEVPDKSLSAFVEHSAIGGGPSKATHKLTRKLLGEMYLKLQVEDIISSLAKVTMGPCENYLNDPSLVVALTSPRASEHISVLQSRAVENALHLQETLRAAQHDCLSTEDANLILLQLQSLLYAISPLDMIEEDISLSLQYLRLAQPLEETNLSTRIDAAFVLEKLSRLYGEKGDKKSQLRLIAQAVHFMRDSGKPFWEHSCMSDFIAGQRYLWHASFLFWSGDLSGAIVEIRNSLELTEAYLSKPPQDTQHIFTAELHLAAAYFLVSASWKIRDNIQAVEALKRALRASEYLHSNGDETDRHHDIAGSLFWLSHNRLQPILPPDEYQQYLQKCVELYRMLSSQCPTKYGCRLYSCLCREMRLLRSEGKEYEALIVEREAELWRVYAK